MRNSPSFPRVARQAAVLGRLGRGQGGDTDLGPLSEKVNVTAALARSATPIGASGARILGDAHRHDSGRGLERGAASLCNGGG
ncbi:MAG TPA: hypothetical protein VFE60_04950 [Roseiarcus sp.]|jgi:acetyl-CoA acetyltransferase|nr:hypothetical protein [Roseiarcus sp.]